MDNCTALYIVYLIEAVKLRIFKYESNRAVLVVLEGKAEPGAVRGRKEFGENS